MQQKVAKKVHLELLLAGQTMKIKLEPAAVGTRAPRGKDSLKKAKRVPILDRAAVLK